MSVSNENLINSETNKIVDIPKTMKETKQENQDLVAEEKQENTVKENGLDREEQKGLEIEKQNGLEGEREKKNEWEDLLGSGSLMKKILREGEPDTRPMRLESCFINYVCKLEDGTVVEEKKNFEMLLGDCEVKNVFLTRVRKYSLY